MSIEINPRLLLQLPIPLCEVCAAKYGKEFVVETCSGWKYIALATKLGSSSCKSCNNTLFRPRPYLSHADLSHADLSHADLSFADLSDADLTDEQKKTVRLVGE